MDKNQRIEALNVLIAEDPSDPFLQYGLVLELAKEDSDLGMKRWLELVDNFSDYLPSYQLAGQACKDNGDKEKAIQIWRQGLELANFQSDFHARKELMSSIQNAMIED